MNFEKSRWVTFLLQEQKINSEVILLLLKKQQSEVELSIIQYSCVLQ